MLCSNTYDFSPLPYMPILWLSNERLTDRPNVTMSAVSAENTMFVTHAIIQI